MGRGPAPKDSGPQAGTVAPGHTGAAQKGAPQEPKGRPVTQAEPVAPERRPAPAAGTGQPARSRQRPRRERPPRERPPIRASEPAAIQEHVWDPGVFQVPPKEGLTRFHDLNLRPELMHAVCDLGFLYCTPVQAETLPAALAGRDVAGRAQTGTGKTAAFLIRIFQHMLTTPAPGGRKPEAPRALVLAPTRELAMQIEENAKDMSKYCPLHTVALFGGEDTDKQRRLMAQLKPDLVVATPGRLLDFRDRRHVDLGRVEILVIDEADRMLDMGFIPDVQRIVHSTPRKDRRQTMFFSATLPETVMRLAASWTRDPLRVDIDPGQVAVDTVNQIVYIVTAREKFALLYNILHHERLNRVLLFANRRDTAARLTTELRRYGFDCALISGALPQQQRTRTLEAFREGKCRILVATDVASRGLHVEEIGHVVNYNVPVEPQDYVHRIGRTGRAGHTGTSITFACEEEAMYLPDVEKVLGHPLACTNPPEEWLRFPPGVKRVALPEDTAPRSDAGRPPPHSRDRGGGRRGPPPRGRSRRPSRPSR